MLFLPSFESWPFSSGDEGKIRFSKWLPSWISDWNDLGYFFYLQVAPILPNKLSFELIGLSVQEKKGKLDFQDGCHGGQLGFPIGTILAFFIYKSPRCFILSFESNGFSVQEKKRKIDFQDGDNLGFPIRTILAIFDLQVTPMLPSRFESTGLLV